MQLVYQKNNVLRAIQYILFATGYYTIWERGHSTEQNGDTRII